MSVPAVVYHSVDPQNLLNSYPEYTNVDFVLSYEGRSLEMDTVRIEGELEVTVGAGNDAFGITDPSTEENKVYMDNFVGAHALIESLSVSINGTQVDHVQDYPRYVKMQTTATKSQSDMFMANEACEMKTASLELMRIQLMGESVPQDPGNDATAAKPIKDTLRNNPDFSFKPMCVLNNASGALPYRKSGDVRLTINTARIGAVLFGSNVDANTKYSIKNLRCTFRSSADAGPSVDQPILARRVLSVKQNYDTTEASLQTRVPAVCNAVSVSVLANSKLNSLNANNNDLDKIDGLNRVEYLFNDATNQMITYRLRNQAEWIERYLDSFRDSRTKENAATLSNIASNKVWGLGLDFGADIDLRNQNFALQLSRNGNTAYTVYFYFHSLLTL
jgi:hypothetical protein